MPFTQMDLIRFITMTVEHDPENLLQIGRDDAAAKRLDRGIYILKSDMVTESADLLPGMTPRELARKCVVNNISDLASKGAYPIAFLASVGLPKGINIDLAKEIIAGLEDGVKEYGTHLVGGDISIAKEIIVDGSAIGKVHKNLIARSGAKPGHDVYVTGEFGLTWLGYKILLEGMHAEEPFRQQALSSVYRPKAQLKQGLLLSEIDEISSSTDSSDGLYWSLRYIAESSDVGILVEDIPISDKLADFLTSKGIDCVEAAFYGGEEFNIVFTAPEEMRREIEDIFLENNFFLKRIGRVVREKGIFLRRENRTIELKEGGWVHFF
ncbi:MAG: thiamine-phosphate kinase [Thermoproteota archaeon]|jgi:thiamine-monophosphate kinase|uniref:Thiamine-monophosphate kinase n=1 Tax=Candidatus Methanodesulfokora washburnensis TaxID=2478471 RepID=A0A3R9R6H7_9CREN|nr:thiamine-phosphate kinase [Candidatus Methanodesulfokores washburnensis]RSN75927.1 thiamine-phosphate kinase [Candidatus Methanodesulfokores washburnensis]RZN62479.1 MAG: thiamine-phosphate kinase [Candidatus Methanodesulfokores washburnensis]TDA39321.1 MAG: thiamine-phosphate kinase [Candidatus Korarchaeota archaeon]